MTTPTNALFAELQDLEENIGDAWQGYGETMAEHRNETAQFGDSWPGAQLELADQYAALTASERRIDALHAIFPIFGPPAPAVDPANLADEPF